MTAAVQSPVLPVLEKEKETDTVAGEDAYYWWRTSGQDLSRMLEEAGYPQEAKRQFLNYFRETICPTLGGKPDSNALRTAVGWDGSPFEYSFEFKESTKSAGVRFVVDLTQLRPGDKSAPLTTKTTENVIESLAKRTPLFNDNWVGLKHSLYTFTSYCKPQLTNSIYALISIVLLHSGSCTHMRLKVNKRPWWLRQDIKRT